MVAAKILVAQNFTSPQYERRERIPAPPLPVLTTAVDATAYLVERLSGLFEITPEVSVRHLDDSKSGSVDLVLRPYTRANFPLHAQHIGVETKPSFLNDFAPYSDALRQCIDYEHARVTDARREMRSARGRLLDYVFLFPWFVRDRESTHVRVHSFEGGEYTSDHGCMRCWEDGAERVAGQMRVGLIREEWNTWEGHWDLKFTVSGNRFWSTKYGATGMSEWGKKRRRFSS